MNRSKEKVISFLLIGVMLLSAFSAFSIGIAGIGTSETSGTDPVFVSGDSLYYRTDGKAEVVPGTSGDIVSGVKYIEEGNDIYLVYQDYSIRWGNVRYMEYKDGAWSRPITVGHDYADFIRDGGRSYITSSDMGRAFLTVADGSNMQRYTLSDSRAIATSVGVVDGYVTAFWADTHGNVYSASEQNMFSEPSVIYHTDNSIYRLSADSGLTVIERDTGMTVDTVLKNSDGAWSVDSQTVSGTATRSTPQDTTSDIASEFHARQNETGRWLMIIYLDGDNSLGDTGGLSGGEYDVGDLNEIESAYDNASVGEFDIVALWDHKGSDDPDTHVLWIRHDVNGKETTDGVGTVASPKIDSYYPLLANDNDHELDMSNYSVFVNFTEWAIENFPAQHYFVDMWDHGGDYAGVIWDDDAGGDSWSRDHISIGDMHNATLQLYDDMYARLGRTLDIIAYDTCLTDHGGIQYHNKIMFDYVGASEHTEGGYGWSYDTVLDEMIQTQGQITADKQAYNLAYHVNDDGGIVTYAVVNTTLWDYDWMPAYNALAQAMKHKAGTENKGITDAFSNSETADSSYWKTAHDYWDMINNHIIGDGEITDSDILYWAHRCVDNMTRNSGAYSSGKLIPYSQDTDTSGKKLMMADSTDATEINNNKAWAWIFQENQWDEMINQVNAKADVNNVEPTVTLDSPHDGDVIAKSVGNVTISGTASDSDGSVQKVQLKIDRGYWFDVSGTDSWSYTWNINNVPCGWHHIMVRSYDGTDFSTHWPAIDVDIIPNSPPTVSVVYPASGDVVSGNVNIQWNASDPDGDPLTVDLYYSNDGGNTWNTIATGEANDGSYTWDTTSLPDRVDYMLKVQATDTVPQSTSNTSSFFSIDNTPDDQWFFQIQTDPSSNLRLDMSPVEDGGAWAQSTNISSAGQFTIGTWQTHTFSEDKTIKGNWTFNIWGKVTDTSATGGHLYAKIYAYDGTSASLLYTTSEDDEDVGSYGSYHLFSWTDTPSGKVSAGDSLIVEILLNATSGSSSSTSYSYANGETTYTGSRSGDYTDTTASDNTYETLTEMAGGTGLSILSENFDSGSLPAGWTIDNKGTGGGWEVTSGSSSSGDWVYDDSDAAGSSATQNDYLYSPVMDCGSYTTVSLSFYHDYKKYNENSDEGGFVDVSNDGGQTWTNVYHIYDTSVQETRTIDITNIAAGHSQVQVRWHYIASYDYHWGIDDVSITGNRPSILEHEWTTDVGDGGTDLTFYVEAYHTANSEGDDFAFYYSTDGSNYTYMLTVTKTSDDNSAQTYSLPSDLTGTIYIYVKDTDRTESNGNADSLYVDYMAIKVTRGAPQFVMAFDGLDYESNVLPSIAEPPTIDINFQQGWNLVSLPWLSSPTDINTALNGVDWSRAMVYQNGHWYTYNKDRDAKFNTGFPMVDNTMGIWVYANQGYTLTGPGDDIGSTTITLHPGWNLVGYPSGTSRSMSDVMNGIAYDHIQAFDGSSIFDLGGSDMMTPGAGYWIYVTSTQDWTVQW